MSPTGAVLELTLSLPPFVLINNNPDSSKKNDPCEERWRKAPGEQSFDHPAISDKSLTCRRLGL